MAPMEQINLFECQPLSYCFRNGICMRHVRTQEISCQCYDGWAGPECASLMSEQLPHQHVPAVGNEIPGAVFIIALVLLFLAALACVAYAVRRCQKYPESSIIQLRADRKADRAAALDLLDSNQKVAIDMDD